MKEPLYMLMKVSYDALLDEACKEVKDHSRIAYYAREVAGYAKKIEDRAIDDKYKGVERQHGTQ